MCCASMLYEIVLQQLAPGGSDIYPFCENEDDIFYKKYLGVEPRPAGPSQIFSIML